MHFSFHERRTLILIRNLILENKQHPIRLTDLAIQFAIDERRLRRGFKYYFNTSISNFYLEHSMNYARSLLDDGHSIKEVANMLGYGDRANFSRAYKKYFGHYPSERSMQ